MGDNIYVSYWKSVLPSLIEQFKEGKQIIQIEVKQLTQYGNRQSYYANFRISQGKIEIPKNAYAQGRDLFAVLIQDEYFKENFSDRIIQITISKDLKLKIELLGENMLAFFTEEDFEQLILFAKKTKETGNEEHQKAYDYLKNTYSKTAYWAKEVQRKIFPQGYVNVVQKPTNQANKFEFYHWAKIYPDKKTYDYLVLSYTVGIDTRNQFVIKIDTVGLSDRDERRLQYLQIRGDYTNSKIVKILPKELVLDKGWKYLIDLTSNIINSLKPDFDTLLQSLQKGYLNAESFQDFNKLAMPLNTILYGPPGTGKTYQSISKAVAIADPQFDISGSTREQLKAEYQRLVNEKQIEFITFHQSMSYEDFIEGIKPNIGSSGNEISYNIEDGVFKRLSIRAAQKVAVEDNFNIVYEKLLQEIEENDGSLILKTLKKAKEFTVYENSKGNLRFHANTEKAYEGVLTKEYVSTYLQTGEVAEWPSYTRSVGEYLKSKYGYKNEQKKVHRNYVLIIDEINRGSVSQIFGELITLIEEDKRVGKKEALTITLPYSKKPFSVPSNLYIVGTMNTADRSVEALDTALRRRFVFEEMPPQSKLLSPQRMLWQFWWDFEKNDWDDNDYIAVEAPFYKLLGVPEEFKDNDWKEAIWIQMKQAGKNESQVDLFNDMNFTGINLQLLLEKINFRLEALLSKDHTIGHAWLMGINSLENLQEAFKNKILPLLQEFFYNDYAKIGLVLGSVFLQTKRIDRGLFAKFKESEELANEYLDTTVFILKDPFEIDLDGFKTIYVSGKP